VSQLRLSSIISFYWNLKCRYFRPCFEEKETIGHMRNGCSEIKEERKERGEIPNEDGREMRWIKEIWNSRERMEKERRQG
jgi:hypothetical protein